MHWIILALLIPYIYILLKVYRSLLKIRPYSAGTPSAEFVTIIAACRNEEINLPLLLGDIALQDYPQDMFEVIVVDDNSSDSTYDTAGGSGGIRNIRVIKNTGEGKKAAIRTGVRMASGSLIITVDADSRMKTGWLRTIVSFYEKEKPEMIICPVTLKGGNGFFHRFQELEFLSLQGITAGKAAGGDPVMCNGANLLFTKKSFEEHSMELHDEFISGDDIFLLHAIKKDNRNRILWLESGNALVTTKTSHSPGSFLAQRARWISKAGCYSDSSTSLLAIVTLAAVLLQISALITGIFDQKFLILFAAVFTLKSVPDYLILKNTTTRYKNEMLMKWFFISQFIYPFYVLAVLSAYISGKDGSR